MTGAFRPPECAISALCSRGRGVMGARVRDPVVMRGEGGSVNDLSVADVASSTRRLLVAVEAGELPSTPATRHWLAGAVAALEQVAADDEAASPTSDSENAL
jgi:hypothetical protein